MWPPSNKETFSPVVAVKKPPQTESKPRKPAPPLQTQTLDLNQLREQMDNMEESAELLQTVMALNDVDNVLVEELIPTVSAFGEQLTKTLEQYTGALDEDDLVRMLALNDTIQKLVGQFHSSKKAPPSKPSDFSFKGGPSPFDAPTPTQPKQPTPFDFLTSPIQPPTQPPTTTQPKLNPFQPDFSLFQHSMTTKSNTADLNDPFTQLAHRKRPGPGN